jgi:phage FluMu protein gp41
LGKRLDTHLSEEDRLALEQVVERSTGARERAKTLLLLGQSLLCREVAQVQDLNICTVGQTWRRWCQEGMACLSDKPRTGAPRKLDEAAAKASGAVAVAGERAAVVMSLLQSAKLCGHDPFAYLKDVLTRLPTQLNSRIEELLPHSWQPGA